jgi:hypothetical protein
MSPTATMSPDEFNVIALNSAIEELTVKVSTPLPDSPNEFSK